MPTYSALTVRKLKPGTYDEWRKAWGGGSDEQMPEGVQAYILRNVKDPDEIIAFGLIEGELEQIQIDDGPRSGARTPGGDGSLYRVDRRGRDLRGRRAIRLGLKLSRRAISRPPNAAPGVTRLLT